MSGHPKRPLILVIEDDERVREMLRVFLSGHGYDVSLSEDGFEGLEDAHRLHPDLILLDLRLPGRPGEEICKAIREDEDKRFAGTPILMITGKVEDVDRVIGMVIGATGYLPKPFPLSVLGKEVRRCLSRGPTDSPLAAA
jgi:DNA-binding response OmpR family regulator